MKKILDKIKLDIDFIQSHQLQPKWYKVLKVVLLLGILLGYSFFFGWGKTFAFFIVFMLLSLAVHFIYRINTRKYTQSWLDFKVVKEDGKVKPVSIGFYYYLAVIINAVLAALISQICV